MSFAKYCRNIFILLHVSFSQKMSKTQHMDLIWLKKSTPLGMTRNYPTVGFLHQIWHHFTASEFFFPFLLSISCFQVQLHCSFTSVRFYVFYSFALTDFSSELLIFLHFFLVIKLDYIEEKQRHHRNKKEQMSILTVCTYRDKVEVKP